MLAKLIGSVAGAVTAGLGSAVCCSGPFVAGAMGWSGAGLLAWRPFRPLFVFVAAGLLWTGFYLLDREDQAACEIDGRCLGASTRRAVRISLWLAVGVVLILGTSSRWLPWIL